MLRSILTTTMVCLQICLLLAVDGQYHSVKAKKGDGVYSLLRRYHLSSYECNITNFYTINDLRKDEHLHAGKRYKIPVKIYTYNGRSIRSTIGIDDWETAIQIKTYNETIQEKGVRQTSYLDSKILWVPHHLIACRPTTAKVEKISTKTIKVKSEENVVYNELFGEKYARVPIEDQRLKGQVYYVVSGHGGPDPGACCTSTSSMLCEDEYAYDVSLRLARNLMQHGAIVHMIIQDTDGIRDDEILDCDKDEKCMGKSKIPRNQKKRLYQRASTVNNLYKKYKKKGYKTQKAIMIHVDSRSENKRQDVFFYHYGSSKTSRKLAYDLQSTFQKKYDRYQKGRGYKGYVGERGLYMLRNTAPPAVFVELANIRNKHDHKRLLIHTNRQALANWLFEGMTGIKS